MAAPLGGENTNQSSDLCIANKVIFHNCTFHAKWIDNLRGLTCPAVW